MNAELIEKFEKAGFTRWTKYDKDRLYVDAEALGLWYSRYSSGNISNAEFQGEKISNAGARRMLGSKMFVDIFTGKPCFIGNSDILKKAFDEKVEELSGEE